MAQHRRAAQRDRQPRMLCGPRPSRKEEHRDGALGDVEQGNGDRVLPAENPVDVGRAQILGAVLAQVDAPPHLAGDVTRRRRAEQVRSQNRQDGVQRRPRLRRNLIVSGAPVNSQASRNPLCRYRV